MNKYILTLRDADKDNPRTQNAATNPTTKSWTILADSSADAQKHIKPLAKIYFAGVANIRFTCTPVYEPRGD